MKTLKLGYSILIILTLLVIANSIAIKHITDSLSDDISAVIIHENAHLADEYEQIYKKFERAAKYISLSVSHDDLTNIEESFSELIGAAKAENSDEMMKAKSRLVDALEHLGRLSGINIDSIF